MNAVDKAIAHYSLAGFLAGIINQYKSADEQARIRTLSKQHAQLGRRLAEHAVQEGQDLLAELADENRGHESDLDLDEPIEAAEPAEPADAPDDVDLPPPRKAPKAAPTPKRTRAR